MKKYRIPYKGTLTVYVEVEAENKDEAIEKAEEVDTSISQFCGNGGCDKLIGVYDSDEGEISIEGDDWLEISEDDIEEV